ncbi:hypothetical protein GE061_005504 [Apolygus lucorum]|uniref:Mitochondrial carrier protein n=1 Tax=Apolygus lucorum TaxID=248454 RepID=A0A8S9WWH1_APOLU|nr:hypothetical protein GE061_005504 [Apolygus lucorum]
MPLRDLCDFSAGWWCGFTTVIIGHPLETIKVRMHIFGDQGFRATARNVRDFAGLPGFYKGITVSAFHSAANSCISYGLYSVIHRRVLYEGHMACCEHSLPRGPTPYIHSKLFAIGMVAGVTKVALSCPVELIKTRLQLHGINQNLTPFQTFVRVYNARGRVSLKNFYHGIGPMSFRDGPPFGCFVVIQEHLECIFRQYFPKLVPNPIATFISGGLAGVSYLLVGFPFDVVKSRMMTDRLDRPVYKNMHDCFKKTYQAYGLRIFYHGGLPASIRAFLVNAIGLMVYDLMVHRCMNRETFF